MAITYDAPSDTVTVTGNTSDLFTDILNADVGGGWGQVTLQGTKQFLFDCKLQIGDGTIPSVVSDTDKQIFVATGVATAYTIWCRVKANASFRSGTIISAPAKTTTDGCHFLTDETDSGFVFFGGTGGIGTYYLYSSTFQTTKVAGDQRVFWEPDDSVVWNCKVIGSLQWYNTPSNTYDIFNVQSDGPRRFYAQMGIAGTYNSMRCIASATDQLSALYTSGWGFTMSNLYSRGYTTLLQVSADPTTDMYLIDADIDTWAFSWGACTKSLYRQYTVNLELCGSGKVIKNASVILYNADGSEAFNVVTAVNGSIAEQTVSQGYYNQANGNTLQDYGPFKLVITADGFDTYTHCAISLDEPVDWRITLTPPKQGQMRGKALTKRDLPIQLLQTIRKHYEQRVELEQST